jgi:hypothetical protein
LTTKLKGRHFETTEAIEAESQTVPNTLTEQDFQDKKIPWPKSASELCRRSDRRLYTQKMAEALGMVHKRGTGLLRQ